MKELMRKLMILVVAVLMLVTSGTVSVNAAINQKTDHDTLEISGLQTGGETIDLYQLATATYNADGDNLDAIVLDSKLTEGNTEIVVQEATKYVEGDEIPSGKAVGDEKTPRITKKVSEMPVGANGQLTAGNVTYKDGNDEKTFAFDPTKALLVDSKTGTATSTNINGKFPLSTGATADDGPSEKQISAIAADISNNPNNWTKKQIVDGPVNTSSKTWSVEAYAAKENEVDTTSEPLATGPKIFEATGIYLGKINPVDDTVYNPVIVSVGYKENATTQDSEYTPNGVNLNLNTDPTNGKYFAPSIALKKSTPGVDKTVTGGKNEDFPVCVVATDLNGDPIYKNGLAYVAPTSGTTGIDNTDPDQFKYVKKTLKPNTTDEYYTAAEVQQMIKEALTAGTSYDAYVTEDVEDAYTESKTGNKTGSLGTKFTYEVKPTLPSYPENAVNKTLWFTDKLSDGLDYVDGSLTVTLLSGTYVEKAYDATTKQYVFSVYEETDFVAGEELYELDGTTYKPTQDTTAQNNKTYYKKVKLADAVDNADGFSINYNYDAIPAADRTQGNNTGLVMNYQGVINKNAFVGVKGNPNVVTMVYANKPDEGHTHDSTNQPEDKGNKRLYDEEIVYTYRVEFKKVDEKTGAVLEGAVFGLYANEVITYKDGTQLYAKDELVSTLITNDAGMGATTQIVPGKYYLKEISAPKGYQLNKEKYEFEVKAEDAVTKVTTSGTSTWEYTTEKTKSVNYSTTNQNPPIDGYLVNGHFYELADYPTSAWTYTAPAEPNTTGAKGTLTNATTGQVIYDALPAYISKEDHVNHGTITTVLKDDNLNRGWIHVADIKNTKTPELPSTGGIGTYMFTVAGVAILALAAFMLIFRRKEDSQH